MRVLIACEFSGMVRDAFAAQGHDAWSCDVLPSETNGQHYEGDVRDFLGAGWDLLIAHPPCTHLAVSGARWGHKRGEDGGCFESALKSVRLWGGVLEHPAYSDAWLTFYLPAPHTEGWQRGICGGWSCHVEQGRYGHPAKKATWLYVYGQEDLPSLQWGANPDGASSALVSWCGNHTSKFEKRPRVGKKAAAATPIPFRDLLLSLARAA